MGKRLATAPDSLLRRVSRDSHISAAARRAAKHELDRRERNDGHCPNGKGCSNWNCERDH